MRTAIAFAAAGVLAIQSLGAEQPSSSAASSALTIVRVPSESLGGTIPVAVLLPSTYPQSDRRYPVLYLLHGGGQDHMVFTTRPWFVEQASHEIIIVTPSAGESWYVNSVADPKASMRISSSKTWWRTWTRIPALWHYGKGARSPASQWAGGVRCFLA